MSVTATVSLRNSGLRRKDRFPLQLQATRTIGGADGGDAVHQSDADVDFPRLEARVS